MSKWYHALMEVSLENLPAFARDFVDSLPTQRAQRAHIVGLRGELGAGKTTFVQAVAKELNAHGAITSPTFVLAQRYAIVHPVFTSLVHIDAYRLTSDEVHTIGWERFAENPAHLVLVEWPENLGELFPRDAQVLTFTVVDETRRTIA